MQSSPASLRCFHDIPARTFIVPGDGPFGGLSMAACGHTRKADRCKYWVNFDEIHQDLGGALLTRKYPLQSTPESACYQVEESNTAGVEKVDQASALSVIDFYGEHFLADGSLNAHHVALPLTLAAANSRDSSAHVRGEQSTPTASTRVATPPPPYSPPLTSVLLSQSLQLPAAHNRNYEHARSLLPRGVCGPSTIVHHTTPVRGNFRTCLDLADDVGVPAHIFWTMFVLCGGCDHIMAGYFLKDHLPTLTKFDTS